MSTVPRHARPRWVSRLPAAVLAAACIAAFGTPLSHAQVTTELTPINAVWKYNATGTDLGTNWVEVSFDDSAWPQGPAPLGFPSNEPLPISPVQTTITPPSAVNPTYYFRGQFLLTNELVNLVLTTSNLIDDGAVFHLNGAEAGRIAMPGGQVLFNTLATRAAEVGPNRVEPLGLPAGQLVRGTNLLAVEVHQGGIPSSDMIFASMLYLTAPIDGPARILTQPMDQTVNEGTSVRLEFTAAGTPPYAFEWFKDGLAIPGATNQSLVLEPVRSNDAGVYTVRVSNAAGTDLSSGATLTVLNDEIELFTFGTRWRYDDSSIDRGTTWINPGYDDSSWASGPSPLGFPINENLPVFPAGSGNALLIETVHRRTEGTFTYYYRTDFQFHHHPPDYDLELISLIDDGAVVHLNGRELVRVGMPTTPVGFQTGAGRAVSSARLEMFLLPSTNLAEGRNVIAVEAHQVNSFSSDIVWGARLLARKMPAVALRILSSPSDLTVPELRPVTFNVEYEGTLARFQWFKDEILIPGATLPSLVLTNTLLSDSGSYHLIISNEVSIVSSTPATLTVVSDLEPPSMLSAFDDGDSIIVTFDEPLHPDDATQPWLYVLTNRFGGTLAIDTASLVNETNVVLTTAPRGGTDYLIIAGDIRDRAFQENTLPPGSLVLVSKSMLVIGWNSGWNFADPIPGVDELDLGTAWREENYPPAAGWAFGSAAFHHGTGANPVPVPAGTGISGAPITAYFRHIFDFNASSSGLNASLRHAIDDGAVFYLNGTEVHRFNLSPAPINHLTTSTSVVGLPTISAPVQLPSELLRVGENLLAVELHKASAGDGDNFFACELSAIVTSSAAGPVIVSVQPRDTAAEEGQRLEISFTAAGPNFFQWYQNNIPLEGATNASLVLDPAPLSADNNQYHAVAWNQTSSATTAVARVTVRPDLTPPRPLTALWTLQGLVVRFTEPIDPVSAINPTHYSLPGIIIDHVEQLDETTVRLHTTPPTPVGAILMVTGLVDRAVSANPVVTGGGIVVGTEAVLLPFGATWSYDQSDVALEPGWKDAGYDDSTWSSGPGLLGAASPSPPEPLRTPLTSTSAGGPVTIYFRTEFSYPGGLTGLQLRQFIDDGVVLYLNGQEILRSRVPDFQTHSTEASSAVTAIGLEGPFLIPLTHLVIGANLLTAELHQASLNSSDAVFGVELTAEPVASLEIPAPTSPPSLTIQRLSPTQIRISWDTAAPGLILDWSIFPTGPWTPFPTSMTAPPRTFTDRPTFGATRYYRLREN